jgi:hypothetical protein
MYKGLPLPSAFCRRASLNKTLGENTDGIDVCLLSMIQGMTMF